MHVHVFAGSLDELCSPCTSALLADTLKLGTLHLVRGVGHISAMMECWQVVLLFPASLLLPADICDLPHEPSGGLHHRVRRQHTRPSVPRRAVRLKRVADVSRACAEHVQGMRLGALAVLFAFE